MIDHNIGDDYALIIVNNNGNDSCLHCAGAHPGRGAEGAEAPPQTA